jgi:cytochrome P450
MSDFTPPRPTPRSRQPNLLKRFLMARRDTLTMLYEKSYSMKMGKVRLPRGMLYMVVEPSLVRRVLVEQSAKFPKSRHLLAGLKPLIGDSILSSEGETWRRGRRMTEPAFEARNLAEFYPAMLAGVESAIRRLEGESGKVLAMDQECIHVTADVIFRAIFSIPIEGRDVAAVFQAFERYQSAVPSFTMLNAVPLPDFLIPSRRRTRKAARDIRDMLTRFIEPRLAAFKRQGRDDHADILAALLAATDPQTGHVFTFEELLDQTAMFFLAGHETTASSLGWAMYLVASCPDVQSRIHDEAKRVYGDGLPSFADVKRLSFTRDVFRETLRLYPSFGFIMREAAENCRMRDKTVRQGETVIVSPWLCQRHRTQWERPDVFDPDRYKTDSAKQSLKTSYLPFSLGPRVCLGAGFAMLEATLIISALVSRFEFSVEPGHVPEPIGRLSIRSANGLRLSLKRRNA